MKMYTRPMEREQSTQQEVLAAFRAGLLTYESAMFALHVDLELSLRVVLTLLDRNRPSDDPLFRPSDEPSTKVESSLVSY